MIFFELKKHILIMSRSKTCILDAILWHKIHQKSKIKAGPDNITFAIFCCLLPKVVLLGPAFVLDF